MNRTPEPELMVGEDQARAYAQADFDETDAAFVHAFVSRFGTAWLGPILDLGCGPGNIAVGMARLFPDREVVGIDGSPEMLAWARTRARERGVRVCWEQRLLPDESLPAHRYGAVVSNSLLHHLVDPQVLWQAVVRAGQPGAVVQVADLRRPTSPQAALALLERYGAGHPEVLRRDFLASLHAAFTPLEVSEQLEQAGLSLKVEAVGDRHLRVWGTLPE